MISKYQQLRALLRKDWLILRRNWIYMVLFVLLPVIMMGGFWYLQSTLQAELTPEQHNTFYTRYTKPDQKRNSFLGSGMSKQLRYGFDSNVTALGLCRGLRRPDIGMVAPKSLTKGFGPLIDESLRGTMVTLKTFETVDELFEDIKSNATQKYCFAFELSDIYPGIDEVNITIMFPRDDLTGIINPQKPLYDLTQRNPNWRAWNTTFVYGTPHFMAFMTDLLLLMLRGRQMHELEMAFIPMKTPEFFELPPEASGQLIQAFPFFYMNIFLLPLYYLVTKLTEEKESKAREGMKMMGLTDDVYYFAWYCTAAQICFVMALSIQAVLSADVFTKSDSILILTMSTLNGLSAIGIAFTLSSIIPNKKGSATAASIVHLGTFYVNFLYKGYETSLVEKIVVSFLVPNCALGFMIDHLLHCEISGGIGLTFESAFMPYQHFNFMIGLVCQITNMMIWSLIGFYCDQVMPREFGKAEPWNFLCKKKQKRNQIQPSEEKQDPNLFNKGNFEVELPNAYKLEQLQIRGLTKRYQNGKLAVDDVSMTMYSGQIFALLGHNGAGKTTSISMLTGLLEPSDGYATLNGISLFDDMQRFRENLGFCPQHNVLFDHLTVREHLELFAQLKGTNDIYQIARRVDKMIYQIELQEVQFQLTKTLSGGQKRKLSVGIALIGDAKIIMLDEPTSGMDTSVRRRFWDMIKQYKEDRIIILTTHYMDEADVLGDRICIMAEGKVQCCGSSLFLKNRFGVGYNLKLAKTSSTDSKAIATFIQKRIPDAKMLQEVSTEITWQIPEKQRQNFANFFNDLDADLHKLRLGSYGVSSLTLEEVFLKIGHGGDDNENTTIEMIRQKTADLSKLTEREKLLTEYSIADDNKRSFTNELKGLIRKKVLVQTRDFKNFIIDLLLPCIMIAGGLYISTLEIIPKGHPIKHLSAYQFPHGTQLVYNVENFNQTEDEIQDFKDYAFGSDIGQGKIWSQAISVATNVETHFFTQMHEFDNYLFQKAKDSGPSYGQFYIQQADKEELHYAIVCFINATQPFAILSYASYAFQGVIRTETESPDFKLNFFQGQLPFSLEFNQYISSGLSILTIIGFAIGYMMISDTIMQSIVKERQSGIKHQILISGGSKIAYWLSHYIVDVLMNSIPAIISIVCVKSFEIDTPQAEHLFFWFVFANPLFIYTVSYIFPNDGMASIITRVFYFAFGAVAPVASQILQLVNADTIIVGEYLKWFFIRVPIYNLNMGYIRIQNRYLVEIMENVQKNTLIPLDWLCAGESLYMIQGCLIFCFVLHLMIEINLIEDVLRPFLKPMYRYLQLIDSTLQRKKSQKAYNIRMISQLDDDTRIEQKVYKERIQDSDPHFEQLRVKSVKNASVKIEELSKAYTPYKNAVDQLSFALDYGECFALLGVTGAGKTTTFKCLTGESIPDKGQMYLAGYNLRQSLGFANARSKVGYCPQFDAIYEGLTVREHLELYATIKGVRTDYQQELVIRQIKELDLTQYQHVKAGTLSGGNKRKLQCAIALIGNPPIILLDEPSTGVDPHAKRFMWTVFSNISTLRKRSTIILTTHSMEEAEALCSKIGIMVDGQFQCFGSAQHIKDKYSDGYDIQVVIQALTNDQLAQLISKYGYQKHDELDEYGVQDLMFRTDLQHLWQTLVTAESTLEQIFKQNSPFSVVDVLKWVHVESQGYILKQRLEKTFGKAEISEHFSNKFLYKVARANHSIGFVFGFMEKQKTELSIGEYSATQTTLEQIFNMFANQKPIDEREERRKVHAKKSD